jgi:hypothetical protein
MLSRAQLCGQSDELSSHGRRGIAYLRCERDARPDEACERPVIGRYDRPEGARSIFYKRSAEHGEGSKLPVEWRRREKRVTAKPRSARCSATQHETGSYASAGETH